MTAMLGPVLRMLVSLAVVLALMYIAARLMRRTHGGASLRVVGSKRPTGLRALRSVVAQTTKPGRAERATRRRARLEVLARQPLGKSTSVAVVRVADRTLLLGMSESSVQLLTELDAETFADGVSAVVAPPAQVAVGAENTAGEVARVSVMDALRERTVRRA